MGNNDNEQYIVIKKPARSLFNSKSILQNKNGERLSFSNNAKNCISPTREKPLYIKNGVSLSRLMPAPAYVSNIRIIKTDPELLASPIKILNFSEIKTEPPSSPESLLSGFHQRKRARLYNMTTDEKQLRRKLKNRTAAQVSRDRRRRYVVEMEMMVKKLQEENNEVLQLNNKLIEKNDILEKQNKELVQKNLHLYGSLATQGDIKSTAQMDLNNVADNLIQVLHQNDEIVNAEGLINIKEQLPKVPEIEEKDEDNMNKDLFDLVADTLDFIPDDYESDTDSGVNMDFDNISMDSCDWDKTIIDDLFPDLYQNQYEV